MTHRLTTAEEGAKEPGRITKQYVIDKYGHLTMPQMVSRMEAAESRAATAEAEVERLRAEVAGWKRVAVVAALPLEVMRAAGSYRVLHPETHAAVDEAVVTIRMAVTGHSLPPEGDMDAVVASARAALRADPLPQETGGEG